MNVLSTDTPILTENDLSDREHEVFAALLAEVSEDCDVEAIACLARLKCRLDDADERERRAYGKGYVDAISGMEPAHGSSAPAPP